MPREVMHRLAGVMASVAALGASFEKLPSRGFSRSPWWGRMQGSRVGLYVPKLVESGKDKGKPIPGRFMAVDTRAPYRKKQPRTGEDYIRLLQARSKRERKAKKLARLAQCCRVAGSGS